MPLLSQQSETSTPERESMPQPEISETRPVSPEVSTPPERTVEEEIIALGAQADWELGNFDAEQASGIAGAIKTGADLGFTVPDVEERMSAWGTRSMLDALKVKAGEAYSGLKKNLAIGVGAVAMTAVGESRPAINVTEQLMPEVKQEFVTGNRSAEKKSNEPSQISQAIKSEAESSDSEAAVDQATMDDSVAETQEPAPETQSVSSQTQTEIQSVQPQVEQQLSRDAKPAPQTRQAEFKPNLTAEQEARKALYFPIGSRPGEREPSEIISRFQEYMNEPFAESILQEVHKVAPLEILKKADVLASSPLGEKYIRQAALESPSPALLNLEKWEKAPFGNALKETVIRRAAESDPLIPLVWAKKFKIEPYAAEILSRAINDSPDNAIRMFDQWQDMPQAKEWLEKAATKDPLHAVESFDRVGKFLKDPNDARLKLLGDIANLQVPEGSKAALAALYDKFASGELSLDEITADPKRMKSIDLVVNGNDDPDHFLFRQLLNIKDKPEHLGQKSVDSTLEALSQLKVRTINDLHTRPDNERFAPVAGMKANELYTLMAYGENESYTSSFNGLFNRMMGNMKSEGLSGDRLLEQAGGNKHREFLRLTAGFNRTGEFLASIPAEKQQVILDRFVSGLEKEKDSLGQSMAVVDTLGALRDSNLLGGQGRIGSRLKSEYQRVTAAGNREGQALYGLLGGFYDAKATPNDAFFRQLGEKYRLPEITGLDKSGLLNREGKIIQKHSFYNDDDGKASFEHFLSAYRGDRNWKIQKGDGYVKISSGRNRHGQTIEMYANRPEATNQQRESFNKIFDNSDLAPTVEVHRGHSYHAGDTIEKIQSQAKLVWLGSCGGYNEIPAVSERAPTAQFFSTKGTGRMDVNDWLLKRLNMELLKSPNIDWDDFWQVASRKWGRNPDFGNYVPPHKNAGARFLAAYEALTKPRD